MLSWTFFLFLFVLLCKTTVQVADPEGPGRVVQLVACLTTDAGLTPNPGVLSSIPVLLWRLFMKYYLQSFSSLPLNLSRRVIVSYKRKYVHELLVNHLFKLDQEKVCLGELTIPP